MIMLKKGLTFSLTLSNIAIDLDIFVVKQFIFGFWHILLYHSCHLELPDCCVIHDF